ncbi:nitrate- and nitrite sensing domain-containing protein [Chitinilyticum piscinae]|uniref:Nitrate- and nitrite sensing domain-containing protein n=1 Tax=Chitinilyticum piscinae TaxID=2866724 RepID=A0A8J7G1N5_9NEIS|nr:nitrate- and nitrite sensing domain-containing protein [Chitinilyticum piscinae]MBE9609743.1 nitrate- and nitrite sensing domain-containing protein [Chitinilyticum piscinae]
MSLHTRTKLLLMGGLPALALLFFAITATQEKRQQASELARLEQLVRLSVSIGELGHEMQRERGLSAGFISSKGERNRQELPAQREKTDESIRQLNTALAAFDAGAYDPALAGILAEAKNRLGELPARRQAVSALGITPAESAAYYTTLISSHYQLPAMVSTLSSNGEIARLSAAYSSMLQAKERAGRERAMLSAVFTVKAFTPATLSAFLQNLSAQQVYFDEFAHYALDSQKAILQRELQDKAVAEVKRLQQYAIDNSAAALDIDPGYWFKTSTARIDQLKNVETALAKDLLDRQQQLRTAAQDSVQRYLLLTAVTLLLTLALVWLITRSILRALGGEPALAADITRAIAAGRLDTVIPLRKGDSSSLLASIQRMQEQLLARITAEKRVADENLRIRIALDNVSTGVMIADVDRTIIYANTAVQHILQEAEADIRKVLPSFSAAQLVGQNIDAFHKRPQHQADLLATFTSSYTADLAVGVRRMQVIANPVINASGERLGSVAEWRDRTAELAATEREAALAAENLRVRIALDNVSTGAMIVDNERTIVYANKAVCAMLQHAEAAIRTQIPGFDAHRLIGTNIDSFHKNPAHQARLLAEFTRPYTSSLVIGGRHMTVTANPVINDRGERMGAVAEWVDRTAEVQIEEEVENLILAASEGNFDARLEVSGKEGFYRKVSEGLNQLSATVDSGLTDVSTVLRGVTEGDLSRTITANYHGRFGELKDHTNATITHLREVVGEIQQAASQINTAAKEIAAGNTDLSSRTEEQASSLEETASSMEELNGTVRQNAGNAEQANRLARESNAIAADSGRIVQSIVSTMQGISESSQKIADIISVIDGIAFQTNILALNAAVEAARAGEQGRGFAVVASEVRSLALRSATAAKEIKELINESGGKVEAGAGQVNQAGKAMSSLVSSFEKVAALVTEIAAASREQSTGIEQVTQAVGQIDEITQQNAALVEEAAAAAESLQEQAERLVESVALFRL